MLLADCYRNSLTLARARGIHSIACPAISTGVYGYPLEKAVPIAVETVKEWLRDNGDWEMQVILCCFDKRTLEQYEAYGNAYEAGGAAADKLSRPKNRDLRRAVS